MRIRQSAKPNNPTLLQTNSSPSLNQISAAILLLNCLMPGNMTLRLKESWEDILAEHEAQSGTKADKGFRSLRRKRLWESEKKLDDAPGVKLFWPADLFPENHEDVRVPTYGYDSNVTKGFAGPASKSGIFQHGRSLLHAIDRCRINCRDRPLVFVAHNLGGLRGKQVLIEARKQNPGSSLHDVYAHTHAVISFGTPHSGADLAS
ncbi:MAG: hypothetical protein M1812_007877 [Candelaria pacifica]|nr:MAG: hypothetical protein M1812_007877 [Candelaria pacifica]